MVEYTLLAISSLFVIVDPIAVIPGFLAMTSHDTPEQRLRMVRMASVVAGGLLLLFAVAGKAIFRFLGITIPAFQMAGSVVLLLIALDMLRAQRSRVQVAKEDADAGSAKEDIAVTPLAIPMLAGPGAISTVILLHSKATTWTMYAGLIFSILVVTALTYVILSVSVRGARWLNPIAMRVTTRIMGLLLAAIAMQFMINALKELKLIPG